MLHGELLLAGHGMVPHADPGVQLPSVHYSATPKPCACEPRIQMLVVLCARRHACIGLMNYLSVISKVHPAIILKQIARLTFSCTCM